MASILYFSFILSTRACLSVCSSHPSVCCCVSVQILLLVSLSVLCVLCSYWCRVLISAGSNKAIMQITFYCFFTKMQLDGALAPTFDCQNINIKHMTTTFAYCSIQQLHQLPQPPFSQCWWSLFFPYRAKMATTEDRKCPMSTIQVLTVHCILP